MELSAKLGTELGCYSGGDWMDGVCHNHCAMYNDHDLITDYVGCWAAISIQEKTGRIRFVFYLQIQALLGKNMASYHS